MFEVTKAAWRRFQAARADLRHAKRIRRISSLIIQAQSEATRAEAVYVLRLVPAMHDAIRAELNRPTPPVSITPEARAQASLLDRLARARL